MPPFHSPANDNPPDAPVFLALVDAAGIVAARLAVMPAAGATSDAIEDFEDLARQFRVEHGDAAAVRALGCIDAARLVPSCG